MRAVSHLSHGQSPAAIAFLVIADTSRDVQPGRLGRDNRIAAFEQDPVVTGMALPGSAYPVTCTSNIAPGAKPLTCLSKTRGHRGFDRTYRPAL